MDFMEWLAKEVIQASINVMLWLVVGRFAIDFYFQRRKQAYNEMRENSMGGEGDEGADN